MNIKKLKPATREPQRLTKTVVERFSYDDSDSGYSALRDTEIPGFEVRAYKTSKTWSFRYRSPTTGKQRVMKIGPVAEITAHQARTIAAKARGLVLAGQDPQDARDAARAARRAATIGDIARRWLDEYAKPNRKTWKSDEERLFPKDKSAAVYKVHKASVKDREKLIEALRILHRAMADSPVSANRTISTINTVCNYATKNKWVTGLRNITEDVDRYPEKAREDYLRPNEFGPFLRALTHLNRHQEHWESLIRFLLLTGARYGEATSLAKSDVFRDAGVFVFRETKSGNDHELPLTPSLLKVIDSAPDWNGDTVWRDYEPRKAFAQIRKQAKFVSHITPHALRHTARTTLLVELEYGLDVVDAITNHKSNYGAGARYVHVSMRAVTEALEAYAKWIDEQAARDA